MRINQKKIVQAGVLLLAGVFAGIYCNAMQERQNSSAQEEELRAAYQKAASDPTAPYPETVTYKLVKMTASGDPLLPEGDTYENKCLHEISERFPECAK